MADPTRTKVELATEADWGFMSDPRALEAVEKAARKAAYEFELVEYDDAQQDALLWLAVRPEMVAKAQATEGYRQLSQDIYTNALRKPAVAESDRQKASYSLDQMQEDGWEL